MKNDHTETVNLVQQTNKRMLTTFGDDVTQAKMKEKLCKLSLVEPFGCGATIKSRDELLCKKKGKWANVSSKKRKMLARPSPFNDDNDDCWENTFNCRISHYTRKTGKKFKRSILFLPNSAASGRPT